MDVMRRRLDRRTVLRGALGAAAGALGGSLLTGCGASADPATIRFWHLLQGSDGGIMESMQNAAAAAAGLRADATVLAWGYPYYTKLAMASAGGRPPDLGIMHVSRLAGYAPGGLLQPFDTDLLAQLGAGPDAFLPDLLDRASIDGSLYAVPIDTHPFVMFYAPAVLERAGLLGPDGRAVPLDGLDTFVAAAREIAGVTGAYGAAYGFLSDEAHAWRMFLTLYTQAGAAFDLPSGGPARMDPDAAARAVDAGKQLFDGTVISPNDDYPSAIASFVGGRSGIYLGGEWELVSFQDAGIEFDAVPFPTLLDVPAAAADSHALVLPGRAARSEQVRQDVHRLVAGLLGESLQWARAGHIPAYQPVTRSPEYAGLQPQSNYAAAQESVVLDPPAWFTGAGSNFQARMSQPLVSAWSAGAGTAETVAALQRELDVFVSRPDPVRPDSGGNR